MMWENSGIARANKRRQVLDERGNLLVDVTRGRLDLRKSRGKRWVVAELPDHNNRIPQNCY